MELLVVATFVAGIAAALIPFHVHHEREDARQRTLHNLQEIRSQLRQYSADHQGWMPANLANLMCLTDINGDFIRGDARPTGQPQIHPYLKTLPENAFREAISGCRNQVVLIEVIRPRRCRTPPEICGAGYTIPRQVEFGSITNSISSCEIDLSSRDLFS